MHLFLSLRFSKGVSVGVGMVESLLSALLITGLGSEIWVLIPCAWGLRFLQLFGIYRLGGARPANSSLHVGIVCCVMETILMCVFSLVWFYRWEGKKAEE